jgi:pilus assembly protein CpaB
VSRRPPAVTPRRRRGLLLLAVALASGGLAASQVHEREQRAAQELGPPVEVLVAARDLRAGARASAGAVALRRVPARFAPPDALTAQDGVVGARVSAPVAAGGYLTAGLFARREGRTDGLRRGERAVTVEVAGGSALADLAPGAHVDVLVSTETGAGGGRTVMALAGAELVRMGEAVGGGYDESGIEAEAAADPSSAPTALATLRVSLRQAIYLAAADNFAREIRLLARPPGDRGRPGAAIDQADL